MMSSAYAGTANKIQRTAQQKQLQVAVLPILPILPLAQASVARTQCGHKALEWGMQGP